MSVQEDRDIKSEKSQYYFVLKQLVSREIKRKYARSRLGIVWSVLNPLLSMAVLSMIFSTIFKRSIENYPIYYLSGMIIWQLFSGATTSSMSALVDNRSMLMKVKLSKSTFIISRILTALANYGYTFIAYVLMMIIFKVKPSIYMLLYPIPVFFILLFATGIAYLLATLYVFFADIGYLYSVLLQLWMYMSAIFFPVDGLAPAMRQIIENNPIYICIAFARDCMMYQTIPDVTLWVKMILWGVGSFAAGYLVFKWKENAVMQIM